MITTPTVLILGAGASMPYGYPSGKQLRDQVLDKVRQLHGKRPFPDIEDPMWRSFRDALRHSGRQSVDAFLEHRSEFMEIGKRLIALCLLEKEKQYHVFEDDEKKGCWYHRLLSHMTDEGFEGLGRNRLSILTFNYDRSLEHFLHTALKNSFGKTDEQCAEALSRIPIVHLHGHIGNLPWQSPKGRGYTAIPDAGRDAEDWTKLLALINAQVPDAATGIKIIHELDSEHEDADGFAEAHRILVRTKRVCFLGFGYNETNVRRLGLGCLQQSAIIRGTAYGLTDKERRQVEHLLRKNHVNNSRLVNIGAEDQGVIEYLRSEEEILD